MFLIFIFALIIAQIILVTWKRKHFKSYQFATRKIFKLFTDYNPNFSSRNVGDSVLYLYTKGLLEVSVYMACIHAC
jgi:hypothetical protein